MSGLLTETAIGTIAEVHQVTLVQLSALNAMGTTLSCGPAIPVGYWNHQTTTFSPTRPRGAGSAAWTAVFAPLPGGGFGDSGGMLPIATASGTAAMAAGTVPAKRGPGRPRSRPAAGKTTTARTARAR